MNKWVTSVKLPSSIEHDMLQRIVADGYGLRGKSRWIVEAVESFLHLPNYYEMVNIADSLEHLNKVISIRIPDALITQLDEALIEVRRHFPAMEGVKSNIIRASIIQRLLRR